jgi:general secretion pathway protein L
LSETIYIRLVDSAEVCRWAVLDADHRLVVSADQDTLQAAATATAGRRVVVLVPGLDVVAALPELPSAPQSRLRQMVPYALEDALAQDVDRLFFAIGTRAESGHVSVSVVTRERLEYWLAALRAAGIRADALVADMEGVPETPGTLTLIVEGGRIHGRRAGHPPFVLEDIALGDLLAVVAGEDDDSGDLRHLTVYADTDAAERCRGELATLREQQVDAELTVLADGVTVMLARTLGQHPGTNLLQGEFGRKSDWAVLVKPWRVAAGLLVASILLAFVAQAAQYVSLARSDTALSARLQQMCQQQFGASDLRACETQARRALEAVGESPDGGSAEHFLAMVAAVAATRPPGSRIEGLSYRNRVLDLQLLVPGVPALDEFTRRLSAERNLEARVQSTSTGEGGVESRVQIVTAGN